MKNILGSIWHCCFRMLFSVQMEEFAVMPAGPDINGFSKKQEIFLLRE